MGVSSKRHTTRSYNTKNDLPYLPSHHPTTSKHFTKMSTIARRAALRASFRPTPRAPTRQAFKRNASAEADVSASQQNENKDVLKEGAKRDPELYVCPTMSTLQSLPYHYRSCH